MRRRIEPGRIFAAAKSIEIHDKWNPASADFAGDIAMIKLTGPVTFNEFVRPVCIVSSDIFSKRGVVIGWGIHDDTDVTSDYPRKLEIPILSDRECLRKNPGLLPLLSDDSFCAGKEGAGVCKGDSGSGYYVQESGKFYLRGIVSSSTDTPCSQSYTAVYSDVLKYLDFIEKVTYLTQIIIKVNSKTHK